MVRIDSWINEDCTIGRLSFEGFKCLTLELPWKENFTDISCIPAGVYAYEKYESPRHGTVLLLKDVHGRVFVEVHAGNYTHQIQGCILVGDSLKYLDGDNTLDVTNSKNTLRKLLEAVPTEGFIDIRRHY